MKGEYRKYHHLWDRLSADNAKFYCWICIKDAITGEVIDRLPKHIAMDKYGDCLYVKGKKKDDMEYIVWIYQ